MSSKLTHLLARLTSYVLLGVMPVLSSTSLAHSVIVWAETVGNQVQVQGYLSDGTQAKRASVAILDQAGDPILSGQLNDEGRFQCAIPDGAWALTVQVTLPSGHAGTFDLQLQSGQPELGTAARRRPGGEAIAPEQGSAPVATPKQN